MLMEMNVTLDNLGGLYALQDRYTELTHRYHRMKERGKFVKMTVALPCRLARKLVKYRVIGMYKRLGQLPRFSGSTDVVVSLTSFPPRINGLRFVVLSLLTQTVRPGKIVIYLSADEFLHRESDLPDDLLALKEYGLDIRFVSGNIRSHKKYHYAFSDFPESAVITVDDDTIYHQRTLERLVSLSARYPKAVCANIIRIIGMAGNGFMPYLKWRKYDKGRESLSMRYMAIGCGGVLYPPQWAGDMLLDKEQAMRLCPLADDLWLKANQLISHVPVVFAGGDNPPCSIELPGVRKSALQRKNTGKENMNDEQWGRMDKEFGLAQTVAGIIEKETSNCKQNTP